MYTPFSNRVIRSTTGRKKKLPIEFTAQDRALVTDMAEDRDVTDEELVRKSLKLFFELFYTLEDEVNGIDEYEDEDEESGGDYEYDDEGMDLEEGEDEEGGDE